MDDRQLTRPEIIAARKSLRAGKHKNKFATLEQAGWCSDDWVSPQQMTSNDPSVPVVMGTHWLDVKTAEEQRPAIERYGGYLPSKRFNRVLDLALQMARPRLCRRDIYVTQACHLLPWDSVTQTVPKKLWKESFEEVTRYEICGRPVVALGRIARLVCEEFKVPNATCLRHPSAPGAPDNKTRAQEIAEALERAVRIAPPSAYKH